MDRSEGPYRFPVATMLTQIQSDAGKMIRRQDYLFYSTQNYETLSEPTFPRS
jgi:hypothetical protein